MGIPAWLAAPFAASTAHNAIRLGSERNPMPRPIEYVPGEARRVLIVTNPAAGRGSNGRRVAELQERLTSDGWSVEITTELNRLPDFLAPERVCSLRAVVAAGGDGTVAAVVNRTSAEVPIAILPLGTENLLAKYLHMLVTPQELSDAITHGATVRLDAGLAADRVFLLMAGCGFDADVVQRLHQRRTGNIHHLSYIKPILESVREYRYPALRVSYVQAAPGATTLNDHVPGPGRNGEITFIARWLFVVNIPRYAGGLRLAPAAVGTDGRLDVCGFEKGSLWHALRYLRGVARGEHLAWPDCRCVQAHRIRVESDVPVPYQLDGDPGGVLPLEVTVLPARVRFVATESWALRRGFRHEAGTTSKGR